MPRSPQPRPKVWPVCDECNVACVLRHVYVIGRGMDWLWQRDCKHKRSTMHIDGPGVPKEDDRSALP